MGARAGAMDCSHCVLAAAALLGWPLRVVVMCMEPWERARSRLLRGGEVLERSLHQALCLGGTYRG